jgi:hypothetical protein
MTSRNAAAPFMGGSSSVFTAISLEHSAAQLKCGKLLGASALANSTDLFFCSESSASGIRARGDARREDFRSKICGSRRIVQCDKKGQ